MDKGRLLALTDGIVAIASTIMVLELAVPTELTMETLAGQLPTLFSFLVSFALIYQAWRSHHNVFQKAEAISGGVYALNGVWLFFVSIIPFATALTGRYPASKIASVVYVVAVSLWTLSFQFLDAAVTKANPGMEGDHARRKPSRNILFVCYAVALVLCFFLPRAPMYAIAVSALLMGIRPLWSKKKK